MRNREKKKATTRSLQAGGRGTTEYEASAARPDKGIAETESENRLGKSWYRALGSPIETLNWPSQNGLRLYWNETGRKK